MDKERRDELDRAKRIGRARRRLAELEAAYLETNASGDIVRGGEIQLQIRRLRSVAGVSDAA